MNFKYHRAKPYIPDSDKTWILDKYKEILDTGGLIQGKYVEEFENEVKKFIGTKHAIAVASCGVGLEIALRALEVGYEDEVIMLNRDALLFRLCLQRTFPIHQIG